MGNPKVGIVMGSDSDLKIMQDAVKVLREFGVESELIVASAHRTPYKALQYAETAEERGLEVIIAGAGAAALRRRAGCRNNVAGDWRAN